MAESPPIAFDAAVLLALAEKNAIAWQAVRLLRGGIDPEPVMVVTPAPIADLAYEVRLAANARQTSLGMIALKSLRSEWGFREVGQRAFDPHVVSHHVAVVFARRLLRPRCNTSAETVIEAALQGCRLLLSWDEDLVKIPPDKLKAVLVGLNLHPLRVMTPLEISRQ